MITLSSTSHSIDFTNTLVTTNPLELVFATADIGVDSPAFRPFGNALSSGAAGPTTLIPGPLTAGNVRQVKYLSVFNADTVANTVVLRLRTGTQSQTLRRVVLSTLESLVWDGMTWRTFTAAGAEKMDQGNGAGGGAAPLPVLFAPDSQQVGMSPLLHIVPSAGVTSSTAYWVYQGKVATTTTFKFVEAIVSATPGTGAQTAEVAFASTPLAPDKSASQSLTKLGATGTVDALTVANTLIRNTASMNVSVAVGTHLWAGIRIAMATTQPQMFGLTADWNQGHILLTAGAGALTGAGPFTGTRQAMIIPYTWQCVALRATAN